MTDREETPFLHRELCPEHNAGSFSRCTLGFIWKYLKLGENFDKNNIPPPISERDAKQINEHVESLWLREKSCDKPSVLRFVYRANCRKLWDIALTTWSAGLMSVVSLWLSAMLIEWFSDPDPKWAYFHSALDPLCVMSLMLLSLVVTSYLYFWFEYQCYILGKSCIFRPHFRKLSAVLKFSALNSCVQAILFEPNSLACCTESC